MGYEFGVEDLSDLGEGVLGASYLEDGRIVVDQSVTNHDGRFRFTAAHELGHMLLHKKQSRVFTDSTELVRGRDARLERQADRFAAALLMPLHLVMRSLFTVCATQQLDTEWFIAELMLETPESAWLWRRRFIPAMTGTFGVSRAAAINRFLDIRLREDNHSFLPERIADALRSRNPNPEPPEFSIKDGRPVSAPPVVVQSRRSSGAVRTHIRVGVLPPRVKCSAASADRPTPKDSLSQSRIPARGAATQPGS